MLGTVFVVFTGIVTIIWAWSRKVHSFFSKHGVPEAKAWFPLGSSPTWKMFAGTPFTTIYNDLYKEHKGNKLVGFYGPLGSQQLLVLDLEMAKRQKQQIEKSLSSEVKLKMDLFSALGEAKRTIGDHKRKCANHYYSRLFEHHLCDAGGEYLLTSGV